MSALYPPAIALTVLKGTNHGVVKSLADVEIQVTYRSKGTGKNPSGSTYFLATKDGNTSLGSETFAETKDPSTITKNFHLKDEAQTALVTQDGTWRTAAAMNGLVRISKQNQTVGTSYEDVRSEAGFKDNTDYTRYYINKEIVGVTSNGTDLSAASAESQKIFNDEAVFYVEGAAPTDPGTTPPISGTTPSDTTQTNDTFLSKKNLHIETNLRMLTRGFGGTRTVIDRYPNGKIEAHDYGVKWRSGLIHTYEDSPMYSTFTHMYGFRFHYNPTSWTQNVAMTESIDPQNVLGSQPKNLPLMGGWAGIGLTVFVNRVIEMSMTEEELRSNDVWFNELARYGDSGTPDSNPEYVDPDLLSEAHGSNSDAASRAALARNRATVTKKVEALKNYGTLADLEFLFRTVNGDGVRSYHRKFADGPDPLAMDGNGNSTVTADYGFLNAVPVRVWLGPHITFVARITSVDISHLLFTERMIPKYSQVSIQLQRPLTWGDTVAKANDAISGASTGDAKAGTLVPGTAQGGNTS